jgi:predicted dehydrogenase
MPHESADILNLPAPGAAAFYLMDEINRCQKLFRQRQGIQLARRQAHQLFAQTLQSAVFLFFLGSAFIIRAHFTAIRLSGLPDPGLSALIIEVRLPFRSHCIYGGGLAFSPPSRKCYHNSVDFTPEVLHYQPEPKSSKTLPGGKYKMDHDKKQLGVGMRGAGQVAFEHVKAIENNPRLYLAAVCSRTEQSAQRLAAQYGPAPKVYRHYEDMLADDAVSIVSICMPNFLHATEAIQAYEAGKHLVLEKPAAVNYAELDALRCAADKSDTRSVVSFVLRWHPMVKNLKALLDRQAIGEIYYVEADYWHGIKKSFSSYNWIRQKQYAGGAMITGGCHAADIVRYLTGKEAAEVFAYRCRKRPDFDYDTTLVASIKFRDESIGKLSVSLDGLCFPYQFNIDLLGTDGAIRDNRIYSKTLFPEQTDFITVSSETPNSGAVGHHPFQQEIDNLTDHILHDAPILSDVADACRSMEIVLAIEKSAATGKPVTITGA